MRRARAVRTLGGFIRRPPPFGPATQRRTMVYAYEVYAWFPFLMATRLTMSSIARTLGIFLKYPCP